MDSQISAEVLSRQLYDRLPTIQISAVKRPSLITFEQQGKPPFKSTTICPTEPT